MSKAVRFNERVTVASLPVEEQREAFHARRGLWGSAPLSDELWDGDRRVFWERELVSEELREILRFRRLARYATMLQGVGLFGLKVPMPKVPLVIEELVKIAREQKGLSLPKPDAFEFDPIAVPAEEHDTSPRMNEKRKSSNMSFSTVEDLRKSQEPPVELSKLDLHKPADAHVYDDKKQLSPSQKIAMQNAAKVLRLDSPRVAHVIHKTRSKRSRAQKRIAAHSILQPWFALLYFVLPLLILSSLYSLPFLRSVYLAWKDQKVIQAAVEVPYVIERLLKIPDIPLLQSTVFIGLFAVEVTSIIYVSMLVVSQLTLFLVVRPLILSLSSSFAERGAAVD